MNGFVLLLCSQVSVLTRMFLNIWVNIHSRSAFKKFFKREISQCYIYNLEAFQNILLEMHKNSERENAYFKIKRYDLMYLMLGITHHCLYAKSLGEGTQLAELRSKHKYLLPKYFKWLFIINFQKMYCNRFNPNGLISL